MCLQNASPGIKDVFVAPRPLGKSLHSLSSRSDTVDGAIPCLQASQSHMQYCMLRDSCTHVDHLQLLVLTAPAQERKLKFKVVVHSDNYDDTEGSQFDDLLSSALPCVLPGPFGSGCGRVERTCARLVFIRCHIGSLSAARSHCGRLSILC
eukprot:6475885-Amphidinium_carterae.1